MRVITAPALVSDLFLATAVSGGQPESGNHPLDWSSEPFILVTSYDITVISDDTGEGSRTVSEREALPAGET